MLLPMPLPPLPERAVAASASAAPFPPGEARARVDWADTAKGICIVLVVLLHSTHGVESALETKSWVSPFVEFARPFRMPDFFLLSGLFVGRLLIRDRQAYFDAKFTHFAYFYVLWSLIQIGLKESSQAFSDPIGFTGHVFVRLFVDPIGVMWFLYILMAFFATAWCFRRVPALVLLLSIPLHLWDDEIARSAEPILGAGSGLLWEYCNRLVFFVLGWIAVSQFFQIAAWVRDHSLLSAALLSLWAAVNAVLVAQGLHELNWIGLALGIAGATAVIAFSSLVARSPAGAVLRGAGRNSLLVFTSFFLGMAASRTLLLRMLPNLDAGLLILPVFACALLTPFVLAWAIKRTRRGSFLIERPSWARRSNGLRSASAVAAGANGAC